jgi:orotidine-5'-phosphate decarboxylase
MGFTEKLLEITRKKDSLLCIGLDTDIGKIPEKLLKEDDPIFSFNKSIIDETYEFASAYKLNTAFYEINGSNGWISLSKTLDYIPGNVIKIVDAKRGDVGNTASIYAKAILSNLKCDAVTVNPYLGYDSLIPFIEYKDKGIFILCLTSNVGSQDFQKLKVNGKYLYQIVAERVLEFNKYKNCGLVVGATFPEELKNVREIAPNLPFLIPGIGAQGGDLEKTVEYGTDSNGELVLINSSRGIIYKSKGEDFAKAASFAAEELKKQINFFRRKK